jgi:hypothetical protein
LGGVTEGPYSNESRWSTKTHLEHLQARLAPLPNYTNMSVSTLTSPSAASPAAVQLPNLRAVQKQLLKEMLSLEEGSSLIWKILVFDEAGRRIISPILKLSELKELGVTLHL